MTGASADFFIVNYHTNGTDAPSFFESDWTPGVPEFHYPSETPDESQFASAYKVKAKIKELKADLMIEELLATDAVLNICATLEIPHITRQVEIELKGKKHLKNATTFSFRPPDSACLILSIRYSPSTATNTPANSRHQKKVMYPLSFLSPSNHSR
ncbi:hypothetical protein [Pseudomonas sp. CHM02]|uniref:hypothetical protein n=1 Tax=Pseudomonas sp. CHM02 TaxID=1463662 RepID=UPI00046E6533|nr:hypothetical protein [Pseudomonas sp. CHM02]